MIIEVVLLFQSGKFLSIDCLLDLRRSMNQICGGCSVFIPEDE